MSIHELQAALRALDDATPGDATFHDAAEIHAMTRVIAAARRVAEGAGEPVLWVQGTRVLDDDGRGICIGPPRFRFANQFCPDPDGDEVPLYTTPPSADALVEALGMLADDWREQSEKDLDETAASVHFYCAAELDAALAKHKENTRG